MSQVLVFDIWYFSQYPEQDNPFINGPRSCENTLYGDVQSTQLYEYCTYIVQYVLRKLYDDALES